MNKSIDVSAKTEEEAIALALKQLGKSRDEVSIEIVERAKSGFLGIGGTKAIIRVSYESDEAEEAAPAAKEAKSETPSKPEKSESKKPAAPASGDVAARTEAFINGLLQHMNIKADIEITAAKDGGLNVTLSGEGMGAVIGRRGETLDAIQHLANYSINRGIEERTRINVDAEDYRSKREDALVHLAEKMAAKAIKYHRSMALEPMNSYERHIIHAALQDYEGVSTASTGTGTNRRVVISCEKPQNTDRKQAREWS